MERAARALRDRLGDEGMADLRLVVSDMGREWRQEVLSIAAERFERRLVEETSTLRVEMAKEFALLRSEFSGEFSSLRNDFAAHRADTFVQLSTARNEMLKWSFVFWISQLTAQAGIIALLLKSH